MVETLVPFKLPKEFGDAPLFSASDEFFKGEGDGRFLGRLTTDCDSAINETWI